MANTVLKPVLAVLTLPLILVTFGLFYLAINIAMVALAAAISWLIADYARQGKVKLAEPDGSVLETVTCRDVLAVSPASFVYRNVTV